MSLWKTGHPAIASSLFTPKVGICEGKRERMVLGMPDWGVRLLRSDNKEASALHNTLESNAKGGLLSLHPGGFAGGCLKPTFKLGPALRLLGSLAEIGLWKDLKNNFSVSFSWWILWTWEVGWGISDGLDG